MSNIQTGAERMPHDLSHLGFLAGQIGRLITISTTPVIYRRKRASKITCRRSDVMSKGKKRSGARPGRPQPLRGTKGKRKGARLWYVGGQPRHLHELRPLT